MTAKIYSALVKAQAGFAPALKTSNNPHYRSKYADLSACIEAVIDALNSNGIALVQKTHPHDGGVCVETLFVHESGEVLSAGTLSVPAPKNDPQGYGSALTYARRYSLMAACGIAPEDDDGNAASQKPAKALPQKAAAPTPAQIAARVKAAVAEGKASEVASYLLGMDLSQLARIKSLLEPATLDALGPYLEAAQ